jgi:SAM-dependent methyltransferase
MDRHTVLQADRLRITGDPHVNIRLMCDPSMARRNHSGELSLGCGTGRKELAVCWEGCPLEGYDISGRRIANTTVGRSRRHGKQVKFVRGDVRYLQLPKHAYDLVILDDALHHFSPLGPILDHILTWLAPQGLLVVNEFVGPTRFQWTDQQLEIANALREEVPAGMNLRPDGTPQPPIHRTGTLSMILYDPSEAVDSSSILPLIHERFYVLEEKLYGGALLHLIFRTSPIISSSPLRAWPSSVDAWMPALRAARRYRVTSHSS